MEYSVLSPWAEIDYSDLSGLSSRLDSLEGKTIGMFGDFMINATYMLKSIEKELTKRYSNIKFSYLRYEVETFEIFKDKEFDPEFKEWLGGVDAVFSFYGSVPSSALFLGYNSAYMEKLGKPTVMMTTERTYSAGLRGVKARMKPGLRILKYDIQVDRVRGHVDQAAVDKALEKDITKLTDDLVSAVTSPLSEIEKNPTAPSQELATKVFIGSANDITKTFYKYGWTNGTPITMPTAAAVEEMLAGTDLPKDHIVCNIPPKMGQATVEKIAVNACMAGCLPTYMPVLIAAIQGAVLDDRIYLEGWTCSQSTWGPVLTVSGKIVRDIGLNVDGNFLSPYYKANAAIARAYGYIMMNIGGLRPNIEDLSEMGHEFRMGFCVGDNSEKSPWNPLHEDFGFAKNDNAVTMFWPQEHRVLQKGSPEAFLTELCKISLLGWEPGLMLIFSPIAAKMFADAGWTKQKILDYIVEYARVPGSQIDVQWLINNMHEPENVSLPVSMEHPTRLFWNDKHMFSIVGGGNAGPMMAVLAGGGDHGGPSCTKIELPEKWDELVKEYSDYTLGHIDY